MSIILGVDPGLNGAIATLYTGITGINVIDMPTFKIKVGKTVKKQLDLIALARYFDLLPHVDMAVIEDPHAMPQQGVSSSFKFGFCCGAVQAFVASRFIPVVLVRPASWKRKMGLTADKDAARMIASRTWPQHAHLWPLAKHDGRAEAALLAEYGRLHG